MPQVLGVQHIGPCTYEGAPGPAIGPRLFGGQAVAQALLSAAAEESAGKLPHSLHAYFLRAGSSAVPVEYDVTPLSEGRSFAARRVEARQGSATILSMIASFHAAEPGFSHETPCAFDLDIDEALASLDSWRAHNEAAGSSPVIDRLQNRPIEIVPLDPGSLFGSKARDPKTAVWMRMREPADTDPLLQRALLAYASDMMFLRNAMLPHSIRPGSSKVQAASLDHAIWFHNTPNFNNWHLFATESPWAGHARGLNRGHFYDLEGNMIATVSQESLMRPRGEGIQYVEPGAVR